MDAANPNPQLRITQLTVENWRNFTEVNVELQRRVFLVGPNASGKSNLLDVIRFLRDIVSVGGGFQAAVLNRGGVSRLRCLAARRFPDVRIHIRLGTDEEPDVWRYDLQFAQDNRQRPVIKRETVWQGGSQLLDRPDEKDHRDPDRLTQTYLEQVHANQEFRKIAEFLAQVRYLHIVPQLVRDPNRSVGRHDDPYGGDFLEQVVAKPEKTRNAWLRRITQALKLAVPQLSELELWRDSRGVPHLRGKYAHWRPQGAWQTEDQFSDGTLRLMGLLWAALDGTGPLLLEEPELSLHPEVVQFLPQMFHRMQRRTGRQILVSTHSKQLLQDEGIGLDEVLLLVPDNEGTQVSLAADRDEIRSLLEDGSSMADAVMPHTRPTEARQLPLFAE